MELWGWRKRDLEGISALGKFPLSVCVWGWGGISGIPHASLTDEIDSFQETVSTTSSEPRHTLSISFQVKEGNAMMLQRHVSIPLTRGLREIFYEILRCDSFPGLLVTSAKLHRELMLLPVPPPHQKLGVCLSCHDAINTPLFLCHAKFLCFPLQTHIVDGISGRFKLQTPD